MSRANIRVRSAGVVIVGGGVIGLSIARELALRGVRDVVLLERGEFGREASWAAGGILAPQVEADSADDFFRLARTSRDLYPQFARALHDETAIDIELDQTGTLYVGFDVDDEREMQNRYAWQQREKLSVEWLSGDEARELEPNLSRKVQCALRFPDDWQVNNRKLVQALIAANENLDVMMIANREVTLLRVVEEKVIGVETSLETIDAGTVVAAAGAWTTRLKASVDSLLPEVEPIRGQMLCFKPESQIARHVIYSSRGYLVPRRDGRLLAGSTSERVGFNNGVTTEGVDSITSMGSQIAPVLSELPVIDSWSGFRPRAMDDLPVLGPSEEIDGLFYATGHYRNGILLAPVTATVIADAISAGISSASLQSFSPNRFAVAPDFV
jgi:glycine oxidase